MNCVAELQRLVRVIGFCPVPRVAPRVFQALRPARRVLPFCLRGQVHGFAGLLCCPLRKLVRVVPERNPIRKDPLVSIENDSQQKNARSLLRASLNGIFHLQ